MFKRISVNDAHIAYREICIAKTLVDFSKAEKKLSPVIEKFGAEKIAAALDVGTGADLSEDIERRHLRLQSKFATNTP